jgi:hypothetical protein
MTDSYKKSRAILAIQAERRRQVDVEGWTPEHDDTHDAGDLAQAAACYAMGDYRIVGRDEDGKALGEVVIWPWHRDWWKPADRRRNLIKAAALIVAEIERLDRAKARGEPA